MALPLSLAAAQIDVKVETDKVRVELGETLIYRVTLQVQGNLTFQPQLSPPDFAGFQVRQGPRQNSNMQWVNGLVNMTYVFEWDLAAQQSGRLAIKPFTVSGNEPGQGVFTRKSAALSVEVARAKANVLPPTPTPDTGLEVDELADIKPDLGFAWLRIGILVLLFSALLALVLWFWLKPRKPKKIEIHRDPGQVALMDLEQAARLLKAGEIEAYLKELGRLIRFYLRHRLRRPEDELTLAQAQNHAQRALLRSQESGDKAGILSEIEILLFSGVESGTAEAEKVGARLRELILALEREATWSPIDIYHAELDKAFETNPYHRFAAQARLLCVELMEGLGAQRDERQTAALEVLGPAAAQRVKDLLQVRRLDRDFDPAKTHKDLKRYIEALLSAETLAAEPPTKR